MNYARHDIRDHCDCLLRAVDRLCALLRSREVVHQESGLKDMNAESVIMLAVSVLTMAYLFYALLHPERF
jgi:K+-transporting ATPase KdpF subunit